MSHQQALNMEPIDYTNPEGKKFTLKLIDGEIEMQFSIAHLEFVEKRIKALCKHDESRDEARMLNEAEHDFAMGHFGILSADGVRWVASAAGKIMIFHLCSGCSLDEAKLEVLADGAEVGKVLDKVMSHSFPGLEARWDAKKTREDARKGKGQGG